MMSQLPHATASSNVSPIWMTKTRSISAWFPSAAGSRVGPSNTQLAASVRPHRNGIVIGASAVSSMAA